MTIHLSPNELVSEFHETYGMPVNPHPEPTVDYERIHMRYNLIAEEFVELTEALYGSEAANTIKREIEIHVEQARYEADSLGRPLPLDVVESADALADLVYVIYGMALESSIPLDDVLQEVQRSNMSKLPPCEDCDGEAYINFQVDHENHSATFDMCRTCDGTGDGPPLRREDGKILKGPNFTPPNIEGVLTNVTQ